MEYVAERNARYAPLVPVLAKQDLPMVKALLQLGREVMSKWLDERYAAVRDTLGDITALRYGVPYGQVFTQIWHYIFGITNARLVEGGLFADPYGSERKFKGFIPAVWDLSLSPNQLF